MVGLIGNAAIIEWLRRGGEFTMPPIQRRKSWRRQAKDAVFFLVPAAALIGFGVGVVASKWKRP